MILEASHAFFLFKIYHGTLKIMTTEKGGGAGISNNLRR